MDKKKIFIFSSIAITVFLIVASIVLFIKRKRLTNTVTDSSEFSVFPLKKGSYGTAVEELQRHLNTKLPIPLYLQVDGIFGNATEYALLYVYEITEVPAEFYNKNKIFQS